MKTKKINDFKDFFKTMSITNEHVEFNALGMATTIFKTNEKVVCFLANPKYLDSVLNNTNITVVFTNSDLESQLYQRKDLAIIIDDNPKKRFFEFHNYLVEQGFYYDNYESNISSSAKISKHAIISKNNVTIEDDVIIEDNVVIHNNVYISKSSIIRSGTILGTNVFQSYSDDKVVITAKTAGSLFIGKNVEIQHNCCVDVGAFGGKTFIGNHVKIDNLCHIAHDDYIGDRSLIAAGAKFSGRVTLGKDCWVGVGAIISNGVNIGDYSRVSLGAVVTRDVNSNVIVSGNFAIEHKKFIDFIKSIR